MQPTRSLMCIILACGGWLLAPHVPAHAEMPPASAPESPAGKRDDTTNTARVGNLGSTRKLVFEGNVTFSTAQLRQALARDGSYVLASHPSAKLAGLPPVIRNGLLAGYLGAGFPKTEVDVSPDPAPDNPSLVVRIKEGPRYRMGEIHIEGTKEVDPDALRKKLLLAAKDQDDGTLAALLRKTMNQYYHLLPQPETPETDDTAEDANDPTPSPPMPVGASNTPDAPSPGADNNADPTNIPNNMPFLQTNASPGETADWTPGDPAKFAADAPHPLIDTVRRHLAELGRPLAQLSTSHEFHDNGTVDLMIRIADEGPVAIVNRIDVIGCQNNTPAEVAAAAGLVAGQPVTPMLLDSATVKLWNTGRFFPFTISLQTRDEQTREVDFIIQAREIPGVPSLAQALEPELETARRFIVTFNEWMATGNFTDFKLVSKWDEGEQVLLGISGRDGLLFEHTGTGPAGRQAVSVSLDGIHFDLNTSDHHGRGQLPGPSEKSTAFFNVLACDTADSKLDMGAGLGFSSSKDNGKRLGLDILITPALPMLKPGLFHREGEQVAFIYQNEHDLLRLDMATALPVTAGNTTFEARDGVVRERQAALIADITAGDSGKLVTGWLEAFVALMQIADKTGEDHAMLGGFLAKAGPLSSLLLKPETLKPFKDLLDKWNEENAADEHFTIPLDPALFEGGNGTIGLLVGLGALSWSDMLAPPDSWLYKLSRELVFIHCGKTQYTASTIDDLLADPSMGPCGCLLAARLMESFDESAARRFLTKALAQATAEGFRRDWRLLLDSPSGLAKAMDEFLAALAAIRPEDEQDACALLPPEQARWLSDLLAHLRKRPTDGTLADWIAPNMDQLWTSFLEDPFRRNIESTLKPVVAVSDGIAVVDGQPIPRTWITTMENALQGLLDTTVPPPDPDPARPWTLRPALAQAVRISLLAPWPLDHSKLESMIEQVTAEGMPNLKDKPDADWIVAFGMPRRDVGLFMIQRNRAVNRLGGELSPDIPTALTEDVEATVADWWRDHAAQVGRQAHLHTIRTKMIIDSADDGARATRLAKETANLLQTGLPFAALLAATASDKDCGIELSCSPATNMLDLKYEFVRCLEPLHPGAVTPVIGQAATQRWLAILVDWNPVKPPAFNDAKSEIFGRWQIAEFCQAVNTLMQPLETRADIQLLDEPEPGLSADARSAFDQLLEAAPRGAVGRLAVFWERALAHDKAAESALDSVLDPAFLNPATLILLADALLAQDQRALAARCATHANTSDAAATRKAIAEALQRHQKADIKGQQDQLEQLIPPQAPTP